MPGSPVTSTSWCLSRVERLSSSDDAETDPELHLVVREQIDSVLHALPTLTASERAATSGGLSGQTNQQLAESLKMIPKAASQAAYRARRRLAARVAPRRLTSSPAEFPSG